jgi:hypothetical protein
MATVAVAGSLAQRPGHGGHAWVFLNYLLGLRRLGHRVTFVDRIDGEDAEGIDWLREVMQETGFEHDYIVLTGDPEMRRQAHERLRRTDLLIDVNGYLGDEELRSAPGASAFLDIDPAMQQMWEALGLATLFGGHDLYFTVGESIGAEDCLVPTCGIEWIATRQPVVLEAWESAQAGSGFTTLASWRGPYGPLEFEGRTFGLRAHEFRRFLDLPERVEAEFPLALDIDPADAADIENLRKHGWEMLEPAAVAPTPGAYREFIRGSAAEVAIAKQIYVATRSGWFSDRSACYLGAGKPVIAVDTGFSRHLPTGRGLLTVDDVEAAAAACEEVIGNPQVHSRAASEIAHEYFDSDKVLRRILDVVGI